jgi:hypothetical protein
MTDRFDRMNRIQLTASLQELHDAAESARRRADELYQHYIKGGSQVYGFCAYLESYRAAQRARLAYTTALSQEVLL